MSSTKLFFVLLIALSFTQANAQYVQATREEIIALTYTAGQIDAPWTGPIQADFTQWLKDNVNKLPVGREQVQDIIKQRESNTRPN